MSSSSHNYEDPEWCKPPANGAWVLLEIKSGVEIAQHPLTLGCTVLGRASDMVDIVLQHESCSRQHARVAFDSSGVPWLRDLNSTHGTYVNKKKLPDKACGKVESSSRQPGARGVVLYPGDVVSFGASTRLFCVEGPEEFERGSSIASLKERGTVAPLAPLQPTKKKSENFGRPGGDNEGVSWGIDIHDQDQSPSSPSRSSSFSLTADLEVPEKHRKAYERLNAMKYKMKNLQTEDERIRRKGELTEGQERQLQRNAEREATLNESIAELEQELYEKLYPDRQKGSQNRGRHKGDGDTKDRDDDTDDFYDRTKNRDISIIATDGESEGTLTTKWVRLYDQLQIKEGNLKNARNNKESLEKRLTRAQETGTEEIFFIKNDLQIVNDELGKMEREKVAIQADMLEAERLLLIVNSKLFIDRSSGYIGEDRPKLRQANSSTLSSTSDMLPPPRIPPPKNDLENGSNKAQLLPPPEISLPIPRDTDIPEKRNVKTGDEDIIAERVMPPPKRPRMVGPAKPGEGSFGLFNAPIAPVNASKLVTADRGANSKKKEQGFPSTLDSRTDDWRAPQGQDGSGITKLNSKFVGRY